MVDRRAGDVVWFGYLLLGGLLALAYYVIPDDGHGVVARVLLYCFISASAAVAVFARAGWRRCRSAAGGQR